MTRSLLLRGGMKDGANLAERHTGARGGVGGGDAHRLTPQNIVPLPEAKFDPRKIKIFRGYPLPDTQKQDKYQEIFCFFHVLKGIFLLTVSHRHKNFLFTSSLPIP